MMMLQVITGLLGDATLYPQFTTYLTNDIAGNPRVAPFDVVAYEYVDPSGRTARAATMRVGTIRRP